MFEEEMASKRSIRDEEVFESAQNSLKHIKIYKSNTIYSACKAKTNRQAVEMILDFYGIDFDGLKNLDDLNNLYRETELSGEWWKNVRDPLICVRDNNEYIALIPSELHGYSYIDNSGRRVRISSENGAMFSKALNFCKKLPAEEITPRLFLNYITQFISKMDVIILIILNALAVAAGLLIPRITDILLEHNSDDGLTNRLYIAFLVMIAATIFSVCADVGIDLLKKRVLQRSSYNLRNAIVMRIMELNPNEINVTAKGRWMSIIYNMYNLTERILYTVPRILLLGVFLIFYTIQSYFYVGSSIVWIVVLIAVQLVIVRLLGNMYGKNCDKAAACHYREQDMYAMISRGLPKIQQMNAEKRIFAKWAEAYREYITNDSKKDRLNALSVDIPMLISKFITFSILVIAVTKQIDVSDFFVANMIVGLLTSCASELFSIAISLSACKTYWKNSEIILKKPECDERTWLPGFSKSILIDNLSFGYEDSDSLIIDNLNLRIDSNEYVAIVGASGAGKSTLLNLIMGNIYAQQGNIWYGRYRLTRETRYSITKNIRYVCQADTLIPGTIRENLEMCVGTVRDDEIWNILEKVDIADFVRSLPYGLDTKINSDMIALSKGQMQRLILARAIMSNPKMIILDEATSALDNISQKKIMDVLDGIACTKIVVAHRLSTVKSCNRIVLLKGGRIEEEGSYEELMSKKGCFYELVKLQEQ